MAFASVQPARLPYGILLLAPIVYAVICCLLLGFVIGIDFAFAYTAIKLGIFLGGILCMEEYTGRKQSFIADRSGGDTEPDAAPQSGILPAAQ